MKVYYRRDEGLRLDPILIQFSSADILCQKESYSENFLTTFTYPTSANDSLNNPASIYYDFTRVFHQTNAMLGSAAISSVTLNSVSTPRTILAGCAVSLLCVLPSDAHEYTSNMRLMFITE
jgi:hypothetical protein